MNQRKAGEQWRKPAAALRYLCAVCLILFVALSCGGALADSVREVTVPSQQYPTLQDAVDALPSGGVIRLTQNVTVDQVTISGKAVTVASSGGSCTVSKSGSGENMLRLENGASLTLENVVVDAAGNTRGRTVSVTGNSSLTLGAGAVLENNASHGAVYLDGSSISMNGGAIRNNGATATPGTKVYAPSGTWTDPITRYIFTDRLAGNQGLGGAVLMVNGSTFTMTGGEISANTALYGGAVYAWKSGDITLAGGTVSNNTANGTDYDAAGGAFCIDGGGCQVAVKGTTFTGNRASQGGAFYFGIDAGKIDFIMTSGTFSKNSAKNGSVIYSVAADCVTDISGNDSVFTQNTTDENGAIYVGMYPGNKKSDRAKIYIHDGAKFTENTAKKASCLYVTRDGGVKSMLLDGAEFSNNETSNDAGVIQYNVPNSDFTVRNCTFKNNRAENRGGCFYIAMDAKGTNFTLEKSTFIGNSARVEGGVWRGYPPECEILVKDCTFENNSCGFEKDGTDVPDQKNGGGCFYFPGDGVNANVTFDGGVFKKNKSGASGGAFMIRLNGGTVTVKGGAKFEENEADVNAGAFSIRRKGEGFFGTAYLLECDVINNVCNADFSHYADADLEPTKHYNTGGVYVGEAVVCHMYDALVTRNYVEKGYEGNTVGSGIGLCPNAEVYLFPEHGAMIYNNGDGNTMDILAVPKDDTIHYETPAKLYICDTTPDGKPYNWTGLNGDKAQTGEYDWTNLRNGIATAAVKDGSNHATNLDPVGFKAGVAPIMTMAAGDDDYKVRIIGNHTREATYAAGGVMVNGTVISGNLEVSIKKEVKGLSEEEKAEKTFSFTFSITEQAPHSYEDDALNSGFNMSSSARELNVNAQTSSGNEVVTFTKDAVETGGNWYSRLWYNFKLKADETITFNDFKTESGNSIFNDASKDSTDYRFDLVETDQNGATESKIEYKVYNKDGGEITEDLNSGSRPSTSNGVKTIAFTATNIFTELDLTKTVEAGGDTDQPWEFKITLTGSDVNKTYDTELWQDGKKSEDGNITFVGDTATVSLKHGQTLKIKGLPPETTYTVTEETKNSNYTTTVPDNATGKIEEANNYKADVKFVNSPVPGSLKITKTNADPADSTKFPFTLTLTPPAGVTLDENTFKDVTFSTTGGATKPALVAGTFNTWSFELGHGDEVLVEKIPAGTTYEITEDLPDGYHQAEVKDATGKIEPNTEATASFANAKTLIGKEEAKPGDRVPVKVGDEITYEITWQNYKTETADVVITDRLDPGVTYKEARFGKADAAETPVGGTVSYDKATHTVTWTLPNQVAQAHGVVTLVVTVNEKAKAAWSYESPVGTGNDLIVYNQTGVSVNNEAEIKTEIVENPLSEKTETKAGDAEVTPGDLKPDNVGGMAGLQGPGVQIGDEIVYRISFRNAYDTPAKVTVRDPLDPGLDFVSAVYDSVTLTADPAGKDKTVTDSGVAIAYTAANRTVTWTFDSFPADTVGEVTLTVRVNDKAPLTWNPGDAEAGTGKDDMVRNRAGVTVGETNPEILTDILDNPVETGVLVVKKTVEGEGADLSKTFTFTLTLTPPAGVTPDGDIFKDVAFTTTGGATEPTLVPGTFDTWTFELGHGGEVKVENIPAGTKYKVEEELPDGYHQAKVENATGKIEPNAEATASFENAKTLIGKEEKDPGDRVPVKVGDKITYEITWQNYKMETADVVITDRLDPGVDYVNAWFGKSDVAPEALNGRTVSYDNTTHTVTWNLPNQVAQAYGVVTLVVTVNERAKAAWSYDAPVGTENDLIVYNQAGVSVNNEAEIKTEIVENPLSEKTETNAGGAEVTPGDLTPDKVGGMAGLQGPGVQIGDEIVYRISFRNACDTPAKVIVRDPLDPGLDFVSASYGKFTLEADPAGKDKTVMDSGVAIAYTAANRTVTWTFDSFPANTVGKVTLIVRVNDKAPLTWNPEDAEAGTGKDDMVRNRAGVTVGESNPEILTDVLDNPVETGVLVVKKTVEGEGADLNKAFSFTVKLDDANVNGLYGDMTFKDGEASFTLKHGESKRASGLPSGVEYEVTETPAEDYAASATDDTGVIPEEGRVTAAFVNVYSPKTGDLIVEKTVKGEGADESKAFTFTVELSNTAVNGKYGDMEFKNGVASFTLKHGESKKATGLPGGVRYTVIEAPATEDNYTASASGDTGTVPAGGQATASFLNTFAPPPEIPKTGDRSHPEFWLAVSLLAAACLAGCVLIGKKRSDR